MMLAEEALQQSIAELREAHADFEAMLSRLRRSAIAQAARRHAHAASLRRYMANVGESDELSAAADMSIWASRGRMKQSGRWVPLAAVEYEDESIQAIDTTTAASDSEGWAEEDRRWPRKKVLGSAPLDGPPVLTVEQAKRCGAQQPMGHVGLMTYLRRRAMRNKGQ